jgi:hypothetical protein
MVQKVNGFSNSGEFLTGNIDFFTLRTTLNITPNGLVAEADDPNYIDDPVLPYTDINGVVYNTAVAYNAAREVQIRFNRLIETISNNAQPVIIGGVPEPEVELAPVPDLPVTGELASGTPVNVYTFKFAIEHTEAWDPNDLEDALDGISGFVKSTLPDTTNVSIVLNATL